MIIDLKNTKVYLISPATDKYRSRVNVVFDRLLDAGFNRIEFIRSIPSFNNMNSLTKTCIHIFNKEMNNNEPFIIIEDDCELFYNYDTIDLPDDFDTLYLGVSQWVYPHSIESLSLPLHQRPHILPNDQHTIQSYNENLTKIRGMCGTHAILYRSRNYLKVFMDIMKWGTALSDILNHDLAFATLQNSFQVFALKNPMFYQDNKLGGQEDVTKLTFKENCYK